MTIRKSDAFALIAGILGFVVDAIALAAFIGQAAPAQSSSDSGSFPRIWAMILLIYGWVVVSWVLAQWRITAKVKRRREEVYSSYSTASIEPIHIVVFAVVVVGLLLLPIAMMIGYDILRGAKGASTLSFEGFMELMLYCLLSMAGIGAAVFVTVMGGLTLVNDEEALN